MTIIEVMVAALILAVGVLGTFTLIDTANGVTNQARAREGGVNLAREIIEVSRSLPYEDLDQTGNALLTSLQAQPGLNDDDLSKPGWQSKRRAGTGSGAINYMIDVYACVMDDAKDGARAAGDTATYCSGSAGAGSTTRTDSNPDDFRRVEVDVKWSRTGTPAPSCKGAGGASVGTGDNCVQQVTLVPNPSGGLGPSIRASSIQIFQCSDDAMTQCAVELTSGKRAEPPAKGVRVTFTTNQAADKVTWGVNNTEASSGLATNVGSGATNFRSWEIKWKFPATLVDDRGYQMTIQAFLLDSPGNPATAVIPVNLSIPAPPDVVNITPQAFGFDTRVAGSGSPAPPGVAEVRWQPGDAANDIEAYQVFRVQNQGATQGPTLNGNNVDVFVTGCGPNPGRLIQSSTDCFDPSPPWLDLPAVTGTYNYYVVALDAPWTGTAAGQTNNLITTCENPAKDVSGNNMSGGSPNVDPAKFPSGYRPGCPSRMMPINIDTGAANAAPSFPANLSISTVQGAPHLSWDAAGSDSNGSIQFYRIYRTSSAAAPPANASRLGVRDTTALEYDDKSPPSGTSYYWVTAVDNNYNESPAIGPVSWP